MTFGIWKSFFSCPSLVGMMAIGFEGAPGTISWVVGVVGAADAVGVGVRDVAGVGVEVAHGVGSSTQ